MVTTMAATGMKDGGAEVVVVHPVAFEDEDGDVYYREDEEEEHDGGVG